MSTATAETEHTLSLRSISYDAVFKGNHDAISQLVAGCREHGFVYLDMSEFADGRLTSEGWPNILNFAKRIFDLPEESKRAWNIEDVSDQKNVGQVLGSLWDRLLLTEHRFKPAGSETGVVEGRKDGFEMFMIPEGHLMLGPDILPKSPPEAVKQAVPYLYKYTQFCRRICIVILMRLSEGLNFRGGDNLIHCHKDARQSPSVLTFLKYVPYEIGLQDVGQNSHTDASSLTLLLTTSPGLQVFDSSSNQFHFIEPKPHHYIMNVGDCLHFLSKGRLKSSLHRVVPHPSVAGLERYSIGYFLSADDFVEFRASSGQMWTSEKWHEAKFGIFVAPEAVQSSSDVLTGRTEPLPSWKPEMYEEKTDGPPGDSKRRKL